ncbi:MAG: UvrD-helicase domain-containing protein [Candidatus Coproplasma sp.]
MNARLMLSEEKHKEAVYESLEADRLNADNKVRGKQADVSSGAYEAQDSFMPYGALDIANKQKAEVVSLIRKLYDSPYCYHIEIESEGGDKEHYYLSACESLNNIVPINNGGTIVPFKQDKDRPLVSALFGCVHDRTKRERKYKGNDGKWYEFTVELVCRDEICDRKLIEAIQEFPAIVEEMPIDEFLEKKLQDNRNNPIFRNIIATLQQEQFRVVETNVNENFIVQGCAGSGKSQCLVHRLFYLRDTLSEASWGRVLLITPTKLFRNYAASLMRGYGLSNVTNCSIAELYIRLLNKYDNRFKNRQYSFELSEEYLPDEYLKEVYDSETINGIDREINKAIKEIVIEATSLLGISSPDKISEEFLSNITKRLDEEISSFDRRDLILGKDSFYIEGKARYEQLQKDLKKLEREQDRLSQRKERIFIKLQELDELLTQLQECEQEKVDWEKQRQTRIEYARLELKKVKEELASAGGKLEQGLLLRYAEVLEDFDSITQGDKFSADEETLAFFGEYHQEIEDKLKAAFKGLAPERVRKQAKIEIGKIESSAQELTSRINQLTEELQKIETGLRNRLKELGIETDSNIENEDKIRTLRTLFSRIESSIFEKEIWNYLAPIKEKYGIQTIKLEESAEGKKENKILYKSDLLFYIKIYSQLYPNRDLFDYRFLCIDEGQDLHKADYDILKIIFPNAVLNVFGDISQVLHTECGISDWVQETGITTVYELNKNYRNAPEIVEFCNQKFSSEMGYIGRVRNENVPSAVTELSEIKTIINKTEGIVLVVKNRQEFERLRTALDIRDDLLEYLDTNADGTTEGKIHCYSIFAAKGLEFQKVLVCANGMTQNQKVVACTRAMNSLFYCEY